MSSLKKEAVRGTLWTVASYGISQILRFGSNLILTRLLAPQIFGLMTLINTFIIGLALFTDTGVGINIIQHKRGEEPIFLNTAWTLQVVRGCGLWLCSIIIAWPVAQFYNEPQLLWLVPTSGLITIIGGFGSTAEFVLNRRMAIGRLSLFELINQATSLAIVITWAFLSPSIWALVGGNVISSIITVFRSHRLLPELKNRFAWDQSVAKELFTFGRWIFISTILTFFASQIDRLVLGKAFPLEILGVYGIAFTLADMPKQVLGAISGKVLFPALSKVADLPRDELRAKILKNRKYILLLTGAGLAVLTAFGDILIDLLYDDRYAQAGWMLPILALGIWPAVVSQSIDPVLFAIGKPQYIPPANLFKTIFVAVGILAAASFAGPFFTALNISIDPTLTGPLGAIIIVALNDLPFYAVITFALWREKLSSTLQDIVSTVVFLAITASLIVGRYNLGWGFPIQGLFN